MADGWHMEQHHKTWHLLSGVTVILTGTEEQIRKVLARLLSTTHVEALPLMSATQKKEKIIS